MSALRPRRSAANLAPFFILGLVAALNLVRGGIHAFSVDGGAHSIAGLDIAENRQTILSLFAILGFHQIVAGLFEAYVLVFRRDLITIALGVQLAETIAGVTNLYLYRTFPVSVPGAPFNLAVLFFVGTAFLLSLLKERGRAA